MLTQEESKRNSKEEAAFLKDEFQQRRRVGVISSVQVRNGVGGFSGGAPEMMVKQGDWWVATGSGKGRVEELTYWGGTWTFCHALFFLLDNSDN